MIKEYSGYVTTREMNGMSLPITLQHSAMKKYCEQRNGIYKLAQTELVVKNSVLILFSILNKLKQNDNAIMCSINMLPRDYIKREKIYKIVISKRLKIHFVFENFILSNKKNILEIENFYNLVYEINNNNFHKYIKEFQHFEIIN